jgi:hypothetical protein
MSNRKQRRLARALVESQTIPYQQALKLVLATAPTHALTTALPFPLIPDLQQPPAGIIPLGIEENGQAWGLEQAALTQHLWLTGANHQQLLDRIAVGAVQNDQAVLVIDPYGRIADNFLNHILSVCPERGDDIIYCDLSDRSQPVAFNPLAVTEFDDIPVVAQSARQALAALCGPDTATSAPRALNLWSQAISALCYANLVLPTDNRCNLAHAVDFFRDAEFRRLVMEFCDDISIQEAFNPESGPFEQLSREQQLAIIGPIIERWQQAFGDQTDYSTLRQSAHRLDLNQWLAANKIVVLKLGDHTHRLGGRVLGAWLLTELFATIDKWRTPTSSALSCIVDDAPNLLCQGSVVSGCMAETSSWNTSLVLGGDADSNSTPAGQQLMSRCASRAIFRMDIGQATAAAERVESAVEDIAELADDEFYLKALVKEGSTMRLSSTYLARCLPRLQPVGRPGGDDRERASTLARTHTQLALSDSTPTDGIASLEALKAASADLLRARIEANPHSFI